MSLTNECTYLVNSCDKYSDLWDNYFRILKIEWPDFNMPIVLNTETKQYTFSGLNIKTLNLANRDSKTAWGGRLIDVLKRIETPFILFTLEDYYLKGKVDTTRLAEVLDYMKKQDNIACFSFLPVKDIKNTPSNKYIGFEKRPQNGKYRLNCQMALWRRDLLISYIRRHENPWIWEVQGSKRSRRYHEEFYTLCPDSDLIFDYDNGGVLLRGAWNHDHLDYLIQKYGIIVDFDVRKSIEELPPRKGIAWQGFIKRQFDKMRSLI